jgi:uridine phosphorylase
MAFPKLKNKHLLEALFTPEEAVKYNKWNKRNFPSKIIIIYQRRPLAYFKRKFKGKYRTMWLSGSHQLLIYKNLGLIKMTGIGSPNAVTTFEEIVCLGGKEFINLGAAGGLFKKGIFVCNKALRDEGTSHHYIKDSKYSYPDESLTKKLAESLSKSGFNFCIGPTWTIDAPYRETKEEVSRYKKSKIMTVDMEASALFAVAKLRGVKIASLFVVSDTLEDEKWDPQFKSFNYKRTLNQMVDIAVDCLLNCSTS